MISKDSSLSIYMGIGLMLASLFSWTLAQAADPVGFTTVQLDQPVYFLDGQGDNIQVQAGQYQLEALSDGLLLESGEGKSPIAIQATLDTHSQELPEPLATSVPGIPGGELADTHILALLLPGGTSLEAKGSYSGIRTRAASPYEAITDPLQIYLDKPIHFQTLDGGDIVPSIGSYTVETTPHGLQLNPTATGDPIAIQSKQDPLEGNLEIPIALSLPGAEGEEADFHYVVLLEPDGTSHQALGTYSGIRPRGLFKSMGNAVKKAGRRVNTFGRNAGRTMKHVKKNVGTRMGKAGKNINKTVKNVGKGMKKAGKNIGRFAKKTGKHVGRFAKQTGLKAKKAAEAAARLAAKGGKALAKGACIAGLKASRIKANLQKKILGPVMRELGKAIKLKKVKKAMKQAVERLKQQQAPAIQQAISTARTLGNPENFKSIKRLTDPNHICNNPAGTVKHVIQKAVGQPLRAALNASLSGNNQGIRSRGAIASATIGVSGGGGKIGGGDVGLVHAFDLSQNPTVRYLNLAAMLVTNIGGGGGAEIGIWPKKNPNQLNGWFIAGGFSVPIPHPKVWEYGEIAVDFYWAFPLHISEGFISFQRGWKIIDFSTWDWLLEGKEFWSDHFLGFTVRIGAGKSKSPVDISVQTGVGIPLNKT